MLEKCIDSDIFPARIRGTAILLLSHFRVEYMGTRRHITRVPNRLQANVSLNPKLFHCELNRSRCRRYKLS